MQQIFWENKYFSPDDFDDILSRLPSYELEGSTKSKTRYYKIPCGFDIETTSFYSGDKKRGIMYEWTFGIDGYIIIGRTWEQFIVCMNKLSEFFHLNERERILIGVHNLSFEFQFMRKWFHWDKVFSVDKRQPVYAITDGLEFRCTYLLTGLKLEKVAEDIIPEWNLQKDTGDLDYSKIRHSGTALTKKEIQYCIDDVKIVLALMEKKSKLDGGYGNIPLTKTSYVRNRSRENCFQGENEYKYRRAIQTLKLTIDDYHDLKEAFQGGFTHTNYWWSTDLVRKVSSFDFTSSYPTVMLTEKYPISRAVEWSESRIEKLKDEEFFKSTLKEYCCLFRIKIKGLKEKFIYEHYLSQSRCFITGHRRIDNGRLIEADEIETTITEQDYFIMEKDYSWDSIEILKFKTFIKGYLPTEFVRTIVELYKIKTELKGVEGKEEEYMAAKGDLNALYGMCVMDIIRDENRYEDEWIPEDESRDLGLLIEKYNLNRWRFLFYPWGVWVTAYARTNLWTGIFEFGEDYCYSDTDSIKGVNAVNHLEYFEQYNFHLNELLDACCEYHGIAKEDLRPKTKEGVEKPIGVWDYEGTYSRFKALGAKRYMYTSLNKKTWSDELHLTVSGLDKKKVIPWLMKKYDGDFEKIFDEFKEGFYVEPKYTGKLTHIYIDEEVRGTVVDYRGKEGEYHEKTAIHLEPSDYSLSLSTEYSALLLSIIGLKVREE